MSLQGWEGTGQTCKIESFKNELPEKVVWVICGWILERSPTWFRRDRYYYMLVSFHVHWFSEALRECF